MTLATADLINQVYSSNPRLSKVQAHKAVATILKIMQADSEMAMMFYVRIREIQCKS